MILIQKLEKHGSATIGLAVAATIGEKLAPIQLQDTKTVQHSRTEWMEAIKIASDGVEAQELTL